MTGPGSFASKCAQEDHNNCFNNVVEWNDEEGMFKCKAQASFLSRNRVCYIGGLKEYCDRQEGFTFLDSTPSRSTPESLPYRISCNSFGKFKATRVPTCLKVGWSAEERDSRFALHSTAKDGVGTVVDVLFGSVARVRPLVQNSYNAAAQNGSHLSKAEVPIKFAEFDENEPVYHGKMGAKRVSDLSSHYYTRRLQEQQPQRAYTQETLEIVLGLSLVTLPVQQQPGPLPENIGGGNPDGMGMGRRARQDNAGSDGDGKMSSECKAHFRELLADPEPGSKRQTTSFELPFQVYRPLISSAHSIQIVRGVDFDIPLASILELVKGGSNSTEYVRDAVADDESGAWLMLASDTGKVSGVTPLNWTQTVHLSIKMVDNSTSSFSALPPINLDVQEPLAPRFKYETQGLKVTQNCRIVYPRRICNGNNGAVPSADLSTSADLDAEPGATAAATAQQQLQSLSYYNYRRGDYDNAADADRGGRVRGDRGGRAATAAPANGATIKYLKGKERFPLGATGRTVVVDSSTGEVKVPPASSVPLGEYTVEVLMEEKTPVYTEIVPVGNLSFTVANMSYEASTGMVDDGSDGMSAGGIVGLALCFLVVVALNVMWWRRQKNSGPPSFKFPAADMWEFDRAHLTLGDEVGKGAFGVVYAGTALNIRGLPGPTRVAIKHCANEASDADKIDFVREAEQMKLFKNKNVIRLLGVCMQDEPLSIIAEFMALGDMKEYLRANHHTPINALLQLAFDVSAGLAYLARIHVVHRDLAARNCLLDASLTAKIADFGMTRELVFKDYYTVDKHNMLPVRWMPVEALETGRFTPASDVWSLGVVFWEIMCHCEMPYPAMGNSDVYEYVLAGHRLKQPPGCPDFMYEMMCHCWLVDAALRPTADSVLYQLAEKMGVEVPVDETISMRTASLTSGTLENTFMHHFPSLIASSLVNPISANGGNDVAAAAAAAAEMRRGSLISGQSSGSELESAATPLLQPDADAAPAAGDGYAQVSFGVAGARIGVGEAGFGAAGDGGANSTIAVGNNLISNAATDGDTKTAHSLAVETDSVGRGTPSSSAGHGGGSVGESADSANKKVRPSAEFAQDSNFLSYSIVNTTFRTESSSGSDGDGDVDRKPVSVAPQIEDATSAKASSTAVVDVQQNLYFALPGLGGGSNGGGNGGDGNGGGDGGGNIASTRTTDAKLTLQSKANSLPGNFVPAGSSEAASALHKQDGRQVFALVPGGTYAPVTRTVPDGMATMRIAADQDSGSQVYVPLRIRSPQSSQALYAILPAADGEKPLAVLLEHPLPQVRLSVAGQTKSV